MNVRKILSARVAAVGFVQRCGMKNFKAPPNYDHITVPEKPRLKFLDKVPQYPPMVKPLKMQKKLGLMRGPELVHNTLQYKQYGIVALSGGRLKFGHIEMLRMSLGRKLDNGRMFAVWRIDAPWQPVTKKGQGQRMGGGKGAIDHYVTPVRTGRVIVEVAGRCEYREVQAVLEDLAMKMPFKAMAVSQEILDENARKAAEDARNNRNAYTAKYVIQNNLGGCQNWLSLMDIKHFGKYV